MVAGKQTVNGVRSSRGEKFGIGTRHQKRGPGWCAHPRHQQRANVCVLVSGRYPRATLACHLPPTAHSATKPRQKTALHQDALSTARLGNITEVLQHPFHQRMFGNVFPNKTISNSRIPYFQNMLCWRNCHEIVESVKLLTSQLFYSVVLYSYYCICNVLLYLRSIQTKSCDFGPI